jgi:NitT/TauT family transport system substrate-binding protein
MARRGRSGTWGVAGSLLVASCLLLACGGSATTSSGSGANPPRDSAIAGSPAPPPTTSGAPGALPPLLARVRSAYTTLSGTPAPWWAAYEGGYFREQGIDVELAHITAGNNLLAAMNSGEVQITNSGGPTMILGHLQGLDTVVIGSTSNTLDVVVFVKPELQKLEDVRGKTIGVTRLKAGTDVAARLGFQRLGLVPDVDVFTRGTGGLPESLAALEAGATDGAALNVPVVVEARRRGYRVLFNTADLGIPWINSAIGANRRYVDEHPNVAEGYLRALVQGISRLKTDRAFAIQVIGKYSQTDDQELLGATVDYYQPIYLRDLYPDPAALQSVLDAEEHPGARTARPEDLTDYRFVDRLRQSGFLDQQPAGS